jgi:hypothetical protein
VKTGHIRTRKSADLSEPVKGRPVLTGDPNGRYKDWKKEKQAKAGMGVRKDDEPVFNQPQSIENTPGVEALETEGVGRNENTPSVEASPVRTDFRNVQETMPAVSNQNVYPSTRAQKNHSPEDIKSGDLEQGVLTVPCDNTSAVNISKNPVQHSKSKHIQVCHNFIREPVEEKKVALEYVSHEKQIKKLDASRFEFLRGAHGPCSTI